MTLGARSCCRLAGRRWILGLAALGGLALAPGCAPGRAAVARAPSNGAKLEVRRGTFVHRALLTGELKAVRAVEIVVPRTPSWQVQIRWMEADGAAVAAGQKVIEFDNSSFSRNIEERRLAVDRAANALAEQEATSSSALAAARFAAEETRIALEKARIEAEIPEDIEARSRWQEKQLVRQRAEVAHEKAEDELRAARTAAEADLAVARIELERARRELTVAEDAIRLLTVTAPRAGILDVADHPWEGRKLQVGDSPWVGLCVLRIPDLTEMRVDAVLFDVDDGLLAPGMPASCTVDALPGEVFEGVVTVVTPVARESARSSLRRAFQAGVALSRTDPDRMRPGMSVRVEVETARTADVLVAPRAALDVAAEPARAALRGGGSAEVRLGRCGPQECVVLAGLAEGQQLRALWEAR